VIGKSPKKKKTGRLSWRKKTTATSEKKRGPRHHPWGGEKKTLLKGKVCISFPKGERNEPTAIIHGEKKRAYRTGGGKKKKYNPNGGSSLPCQGKNEG